MTYTDTYEDDKGITFDDLKMMTREQINENWNEVSRVLKAQDAPKEDDDDA